MMNSLFPLHDYDDADVANLEDNSIHMQCVCKMTFQYTLCACVVGSVCEYY